MIQLAISAVVAISTPAIAAGLMAGVSAAASTDTQIADTMYPAEESAQPAVKSGSSPFIATHGPAKLSVLVGNDKAAWDSAHSVHVDFRRHQH